MQKKLNNINLGYVVNMICRVKKSYKLDAFDVKTIDWLLFWYENLLLYSFIPLFWMKRCVYKIKL